MKASVSQQWAVWSARFNERPIRERTLLTATALVVILVLGWELTVAPVLANNARVQDQIDTLGTNQQRLLELQQTLTAQLENDPSYELKRLLDARRDRLQRLDAEIGEATSRLVSPRTMVSLLRDMLAAQDELELAGLVLKAPVPVHTSAGEEADAETDASETSAEPLVFAHDVEITLRGSYRHVLDYIKQLEAMDERLGWMMLDYNAETYPDSEARIRVRTLSLDRAWLGV